MSRSECHNDIEMCLENALWLDAYGAFCARFQHHHGGQSQSVPRLDMNDLHTCARQLYINFIRDGGTNELDLPAELKRGLLERLSEPTLDMFDDVTTEVKQMMLVNTLPRFASLHRDRLNGLEINKTSTPQV